MGQKNCKPQPGDLIEIFRPFYQHWALYVGDGYVIHLTSVDDECSSLWLSSSSIGATRGKVKKQRLKDVVGNYRWRVNNKYDRKRTPRPVEEIIRDAEQWIDREVPYNALTDNCEHFVTELRYGKGVSRQARKAAFGGVATLGLAPLAFVFPLVGAVTAAGAAAVAGVSAVVRMAFSGGKSERSYH
ncbi:phospholipase A and acyltransferase 1-like [Melozone crissalis]|uniref:phospholipase A and acyltransferase 1-like n=1 Tax=Melozone crissalis TaxID=40204 RepID=UPI0023DB2226|nr:phospholipase A and acyltransferase 1-like [Melozone crissalis]